MAIGNYDVLSRASRELRALPERGWMAVEQRVIDAVRATPRGGWPLEVVDPHPGQAPGRIEVSDLVLRAGVARAVRPIAQLLLVDVAVTLLDKTLRGVRVELSGRYGADLVAATARARTLVTAAIVEIVGDAGTLDVDIAVTDIHR